MNKKAKIGLVTEEFAFLIAYVLFIILTISYVYGIQNGNAITEEFYAKEITRIINQAQVGTEIKIDVTELTSKAIKNNKKIEDTIRFDNTNNQIIVSVRQGKGTSYHYYNNVNVKDAIVKPVSGGKETNRLEMRITPKQE